MTPWQQLIGENNGNTLGKGEQVNIEVIFQEIFLPLRKQNAILSTSKLKWANIPGGPTFGHL